MIPPVLDLERFRADVIALCRQHGVRRLALFGSALTPAFAPSSDIDLLVDLDDSPRALRRYLQLKLDLERLFARPVDLVMPSAITNQRFRAHITGRDQVVYAA